MSKPPEGMNGRRRSMGIFPRPALSSLTSINTTGEAPKKRRPVSGFFGSSSSSGTEPDLATSKSEGEPLPSPKTRSRNLLKNGRPTSIFGSLRGMTSSLDEEGPRTFGSLSRENSAEDEGVRQSVVNGRTVLHHGEVQTTGGLFKKKKEYLVLTDKHLVRFKSQSKASEVFPSIPASLGRSNTLKHASIGSMGSVGSQSEHQTVASDSDPQRFIALNQIIAVFKVEDGKPYFSIEISHVVDEAKASSMIIQLSDPQESELWLSSIRGAATKARLLEPTVLSDRTVDYVARRLEQERDYHPDHFRVFKVVQRPANATGGRASSDDLSKLASSVCFLAVGLHMVHLIALPRSGQRSASTTSFDKYEKAIYGLLNLLYLNIKPTDDAFELSFREPLRATQRLYLASSDAVEIAICIRQGAEYLRPSYVMQPFNFQAPRGVEETLQPIPSESEDYDAFDRTLIAHCAAYHRDTSVIAYTVNHHVEDSPQFVLLPPAHPRRATYNIYELLAVFRSLRYNESFRSISFAGVNLDVLHQVHDDFGDRSRRCVSRSGAALSHKRDGSNSLLVQEVQNLALKSRTLRRLDFSYCIERKPQDRDEDNKDPGCELCEALYPICWRQFTNVDWMTFNGIEMGETDLDYLVDAMVHRTCHLRALEFSRCGLTDRSLTLILNAMLSQDRTLESIDISGNLARVSPPTFQGQIGHFSYIRKLNLSRVHRTSGREPLVAPETLLAWRLEQLQLSETVLNEETVDSISTYLASPMSDTLREVWLNQCNLKGSDIAVFMRSMSRTPGQARELHLHVSENRIEEGHHELVSAIAGGHTPSSLTMRMAVYDKEYQFREFLQALRQNTTLRYLDIAKASLPGDANDETCETLMKMFAENSTLEELDISGEHAHLEVAKFGIGLNHALTGLTKNTALKILRIEYQKLGFQGANTLSSVLEENTGLLEIYCEHNDINLQGLTVLVNALQNNKTVLYLPAMELDRAEALHTVEREIDRMQPESSPSALSGAGTLAQKPVSMSMRKKITSTVASKTTAVTSSASTGSNGTAVGGGTKPSYTNQDIAAALQMVSEKWERQTARLESFLVRNRNLAAGIAVPAVDGAGNSSENERPDTSTTSGTTTGSLSSVLELVKLMTTPTAEKGDGLATEGADHVTM